MAQVAFNLRITEAEKRSILKHVAAYGPDRIQAAAALGLTEVRLNNAIRTMRSEYRAAVESWERRVIAERQVTPVPREAAVLDLPVRPFEVAIPAPPPPQDGTPFTALVYGDTHFPFQDAPTLECVAAVAVALQPTALVHIGDLVDCFQISRFDKDPNRLDSLQDNIDEARVHLWQMANLCPNSQRYLLEGNHEDRLRRTLWELMGAQRELPKLRNVKKATEWPELLDLTSIGFTWIPTHQQSTSGILPKIVAKHGTAVRKWSGWTAKAEWERYGRATVSGHTHRLGAFFHRDHNGVVQSYESGCTCLLDQEYCVDPDWQQGFLVYSWSEDRALMTVEPVSVRDGKALWRGRVYG